MWKAVGATGVVGVVGYTYNVVAERKKVSPYDTFAVGSAEERLMDDLKTGDVVLFSRKWYTYHIPAALLIKAYSYINDTIYDHAGVVVVDSLGRYFLFENSMFSGYQLRPLDARVLKSVSQHIVGVPLRPNRELTTEQRKEFHEIISGIVGNRDAHPAGFKSMLTHLCANAFRKVFPKDWIAQSSFKGQYICHNIKLATATFLIMENVMAGKTDTSKTEASDKQSKSKYFQSLFDGTYENMTSADVDSGNIFDQTQLFLFAGSGAAGSGAKGKSLRRKGQSYNHHLTFR